MRVEFRFRRISPTVPRKRLTTTITETAPVLATSAVFIFVLFLNRGATTVPTKPSELSCSEGRKDRCSALCHFVHLSIYVTSNVKANPLFLLSLAEHCSILWQ